jgi:hypothetical protein
MAIYGNVLSKIICEEFDRNIRSNDTNPNTLYNQPLPKAMLIKFFVDSRGNHGGKDKLLEVLLFGQGYVTVLKRITNKRTLTKDSLIHNDWVKCSCHDSCWRNDGIESIINEYAMPQSKESLSLIDELFGWYSVHDLTEEEYKYLSQIKHSFET